MSINPLNPHYAMENPPTIYDEEAMTALELSGRTTAKINELVEAQNQLRQNTEQTMGDMLNVDIPEKVLQTVEQYAENGMFTEIIDEYAGELSARLNNLLGGIEHGSTVMDAEIIDGRVRADGASCDTLGGATRAMDAELQTLKEETTGIIIHHGRHLHDLVNWSNGEPFAEGYDKVHVSNDRVDIYSPANGGNYGVATPLFTRKTTGKLYVEVDLVSRPNLPSLDLYVSEANNTLDSAKYRKVCALSDGLNKITIDPSAYTFNVKSVWLVHNTETAMETDYLYEVPHFMVYEAPLIDKGFVDYTASGHAVQLYNMVKEQEQKIEDNHNAVTGCVILAGKPSDFVVAFTGAEIPAENKLENGLEITASGDRGFSTLGLPYDKSKRVYVSFDVEMNVGDKALTGEHYIDVNVARSISSSAGYKTVLKVVESGHYEVELDPEIYLATAGMQINRIWFLRHGVDETTTRFTNIKVYWNALRDNWHTESIPETIMAIAGNVTSEQAPDFIVAPNGGRYVTQVNNEGNLIPVPVFANKALYIGNSLLLGFDEFGMAASNAEKDYFALVNQELKAKNPTFSALRVKGSDWENCTTNDSQTNWMYSNLTSPVINNPDTDLVIIQLGDNVNTTAKVSIFRTGATNLVKFFRTRLPNARMVWVGAWYQTEEKRSIMREVCRATGCTFIDIWDLASDGNKSAVGNTYTLSDGTVKTITDSDVASHPGDIGFKAIANRILYRLGVVDTENHYK